jgi:enamine deaminase RidA (YjgF/YER057c/UK114 family)
MSSDTEATDGAVQPARQSAGEPAFSNPATVCPPLGLYSHVVTVPPDSELLYLSGQLGADRDGVAPATIAAQADLVFGNIVALLASQRLSVRHIVKLTTFMVAGQDGSAVRQARLRHLGDHRAASTAVYVRQLVDPAWLVEVEAVACRAVPPDRT